MICFQLINFCSFISPTSSSYLFLINCNTISFQLFELFPAQISIGISFAFLLNINCACRSAINTWAWLRNLSHFFSIFIKGKKMFSALMKWTAKWSNPPWFYAHAVVDANRESCCLCFYGWFFCANFSINCDFVRTQKSFSLFFSLAQFVNKNFFFFHVSSENFRQRKTAIFHFLNFIGHWFYVTRSLSYIFSSQFNRSTSFSSSLVHYSPRPKKQYRLTLNADFITLINQIS